MIVPAVKLVVAFNAGVVKVVFWPKVTFLALPAKVVIPLIVPAVSG